LAILVVSDSHGKVERIIEAIEANKNDVERVFFLGDGIDDIRIAQDMYNNLKFDYVMGNNDFCDTVPKEKEVLVNNKKILLTHGHLHEGASKFGKLLERCKQQGINAVFLGHTHKKREEYIDSILFLNPGSISRPFDGSASYSLVEIGDKIINRVMYISV